MFRFAFKEYFPELLGDTRELSKVFFETVSIKPVDSQTNTLFESMVDEIVALKTQGKSPDLIERLVEQKLYDLYELSDNERDLVNSSEAFMSPAFSNIMERSEFVSS